MEEVIRTKYDVLKYSLPLILASASDVLMTTVDTAFVGHIGTIEVAAVGLSGMFVWATYNLIKGVLVTTGALISQKYGSENYPKIRSIVTTGLLIALIGAAFFFFFRYCLGSVLHYMDASKEVQVAANSYLHIRYLGAFGFFGSIVFASFFRSVNLAKIVLKVSVIANVSNIILDYLFIFVLNKGLNGAAIATVTSQWLCLIIYIAYYYNKMTCLVGDNYIKSKLIDIDELIKLLKIGIPYSLKFFSEMMVFFLFVMMTGWISNSALAATTIMLQIIVLTNMTGSGIGYAAQTLVGQKLGSNEIRKAKHLGKLCIKTNLIITISMSLVLLLLAKQIILLFNTDPDVAKTFASIVILGCFVINGDGLQIVISHALNGASDTKSQFNYMLMTGYLFFLPVCYLLITRFENKIVYAWLAMAIFIAIFSILLLYRFLVGTWKVLQENKC
jgi:multidrug resistance protein, MATE family